MNGHISPSLNQRVDAFIDGGYWDDFDIFPAQSPAGQLPKTLYHTAR